MEKNHLNYEELYALKTFFKSHADEPEFEKLE